MKEKFITEPIIWVFPSCYSIIINIYWGKTHSLYTNINDDKDISTFYDFVLYLDDHINDFKFMVDLGRGKRESLLQKSKRKELVKIIDPVFFRNNYDDLIEEDKEKPIYPFQKFGDNDNDDLPF